MKERKSPAYLSKVRKIAGEPGKRTGPRSLGIPRMPGILGACSKAKLGLKQFKGACQETQGIRIDMFL